MSRETKLSGAKGDGETLVFRVELTTSQIGNHIRLISSVLEVTHL